MQENEVESFKKERDRVDKRTPPPHPEDGVKWPSSGGGGGYT